ncbi:MAG: AsmA family protein [Burkholderiales bacterium]|nr:AsmA family protein [Burkholderiales bacterium]
MESAAAPQSGHRKLWVRLAVGLATFLVFLVLLVVFFPWDVLRGPVNRYVSDKTGRTFEITQRLEVHPGRTTSIVLHGVRFANPDWARDPQLIEAERIELDLAFWPLLRKQIVIPRLHLYKPSVAMQLEADGRRSWAMGKDTSDTSSVPRIGVIQVDEGVVKYYAAHQGADATLSFSFDPSAGELPLQYKATGTWTKQAFTAQGRAGNVLQLTEAGAPPFPLEIDARAGRTRLTASGTVARIADFDGLNAAVELRGATLGDLFPLIGVSLPQTSPYALKGQLQKNGERWQVAEMQGRLGQSDLSGELSYESVSEKPLLVGNIRSRVLDMDDLGPLIGLPSSTRSIPASTQPPSAPAGAKPESTEAASAEAAPSAAPRPPAGRVLPTAKLDTARLRAMNADVTYSAASVRHLQAVPLDKGSVRVRLQDSVLRLDPLELSVAGGTLQGSVQIDGRPAPALVQARLEARRVQLDKLFPTIERMDGSVGRLSGRMDLSGPGQSVAEWLGGSSGDLQVAMGRGQLSNLLLEILGLDGGEVVRFFIQGDRNVQLRCAVADFGVRNGQADVRTFVLDTSDTVVTGEGGINLRDESLSLVLRPQPKDRSIFSLRSPLRIDGTFAAPSAFPDKAALAGRAGLALALGAINPLLALAATVETGPGQDADCAGLLAQSRAPDTPPAKGAAKAPARAASASR